MMVVLSVVPYQKVTMDRSFYVATHAMAIESPSHCIGACYHIPKTHERLFQEFQLGFEWHVGESKLSTIALLSTTYTFEDIISLEDKRVTNIIDDVGANVVLASTMYVANKS